jgi:hypothetical protein
LQARQKPVDPDRFRGALIFYVSPDPQPPNWAFKQDAILSIKCAYKHYALHHNYSLLVYHTMPNSEAAEFRAALPTSPLVRLLKAPMDYPPTVNETWLSQGQCTLGGVNFWNQVHVSLIIHMFFLIRVCFAVYRRLRNAGARALTFHWTRGATGTLSAGAWYTLTYRRNHINISVKQ